MQLHNIKRKTKNKKKMIVARGGTRGKTAGRGTKGQKARAGHKIRPEMRDLIKRIPKLRGRGKNSNISIHSKPVVLNLEALELILPNNSVVSRTTLVESGLVAFRNGKIPEIKILGNGDITKKFTIKGLPVSASAKAKIEKAGGAIS